MLRRNRLKLISVVALVSITFFYFLTRPRRASRTPSPAHTPSGDPPAVIVTVFDHKHLKPEYQELVKENRKAYADLHGMGLHGHITGYGAASQMCADNHPVGYKTFFQEYYHYDLQGAPQSWTKVVAMREALTLFPDSKFFWYLDPDGFIMNPEITVEEHLMATATIEANMIRDYPVVPPDSIIRTFTHLQGQDVDFMITQDNVGLSIGSYLLRNSEWSRYFLETWFDPIYRSYNFQKAETHALVSHSTWEDTPVLPRTVV
jgi:mannan polymerase II complex MNN11 subunit